jgi:chromosome segregation ATPase
MGTNAEKIKEEGARLKLVWSQTVEQLQTRIQDVEKDARDLVSKVETESRKRMDDLRGQLKVEDFVGRLKQNKETIVVQSKKLRQETTQRLQNLKSEDWSGIKDKFDGAISVKLNGLLSREEGVSVEEGEQLNMRLAALEMTLANLEFALTNTTNKLTASTKKVAGLEKMVKGLEGKLTTSSKNLMEAGKKLTVVNRSVVSLEKKLVGLDKKLVALKTAKKPAVRKTASTRKSTK